MPIYRKIIYDVCADRLSWMNLGTTPPDSKIFQTNDDTVADIEKILFKLIQAPEVPINNGSTA